MALEGKLAWGIIQNPNELLAQVLINKYKFLDNWGPCVKTRGLSAMEGDCGRWNEIRHLMGWSNGNENMVKFWKDCWIVGRGSLKEVAIDCILVENHLRPVCDYVNAIGDWN